MADPEQIRAFQRLGPQLTTSGRLTDADLDALAGLGVRHVINLALDNHPEALAGEAEKLEARGIAYTHIPVPFDAPDETHFAAFCAAYEEGAAPVHVHCIMNYRVAAFLYRYHRDRAGIPEAEARTLMERQWAPDKIDRPETRPWAAFIAPRDEGQT